MTRLTRHVPQIARGLCCIMIDITYFQDLYVICDVDIFSYAKQSFTTFCSNLESSILKQHMRHPCESSNIRLPVLNSFDRSCTTGYVNTGCAIDNLCLTSSSEWYSIITANNVSSKTTFSNLPKNQQHWVLAASITFIITTDDGNLSQRANTSIR